MIKRRLIKLLSHAKKYIVFQVLWKWLSLLCQVLMIFVASMFLEDALLGRITKNQLVFSSIMVFIAILLRFFCDRQASFASYKASVDVKRIIREKIYGKIIETGSCLSGKCCYF